jgi:hypothetical protein
LSPRTKPCRARTRQGLSVLGGMEDLKQRTDSNLAHLAYMGLTALPPAVPRRQTALPHHQQHRQKNDETADHRDHTTSLKHIHGMLLSRTSANDHRRRALSFIYENKR